MASFKTNYGIFSLLQWLFCFILSCCLTNAAGQPVLRPAHFLSVKAGLSETTNEFVYKDSRGFVWISSIDGLNRFDGRNVKVYKPSRGGQYVIGGSNIQSNFYEDAAGDIWFTTETSVNVYRHRRGNFDVFDIHSDDGMPDADVHYAFYLEQKRFLWIIKNSRLYCFDTQNPQQKPVNICPLTASRCAALTDDSGRVTGVLASAWGTSEIGVEEITIGADHVVQTRRRLNPGNNGFWEVYEFVKDSASVWMASNIGLVGYEKGNLKILCKSRKIRSVKKATGHFLIASDLGNHLFWIDSRTGREKIIMSPDGTNEKRNITSINITCDSIVWYNYQRGNGLYYTKIQNQFFYQPTCETASFQSEISQIFESSAGVIHVLNTDGQSCNILPGGSCSVSRIAPYSKMVSDGNGDIWQINGNVLSQRDATLQFGRLEVALPPGTFLFDLALFKNGILLAANTGLHYYNKESRTLMHFKHIRYDILALLVDSKMRVWMGTGDHLDLWEFSGPDSLKLIKTIEYTGIVNHLYQEGTLLWAGAANGLWQLDINTLEYSHAGESDGLPNQYIYAVAPDKHGRIWMSCNQGIMMCPSISQANKSRLYTPSDGLSDHQYCRGAVLKDRFGRIWFGSPNGVDYFLPERITNVGTAPQLALVNLRIHDQPWYAGNLDISATKLIDLKYDQNTIQIELAALEYLYPSQNQFKFCLEGTDTAWTMLGRQNLVTFANLPPGDYRFRFTGANAEGIWQSQPEELKFVIHPPFWNTWWFKFCIILLITSGIATLYFYRLSQIRKSFQLQQKNVESEMKALRAQMNPHFIFNSLNSINAYILQNQGKIASTYLTKFAQLIRHILHYSSRDTISLEEEIDFLEKYLELESIRLSHSFGYEIRIDEKMDTFSIEIPSMVLQLFVENAIWHGIAHRKKPGGMISIEVVEQHDGLTVIVADNGVGRKAASAMKTQEHSSKGLQITAERLSLYDQKYHKASVIKIIDMADGDSPEGTRVELSIKNQRN